MSYINLLSNHVVYCEPINHETKITGTDHPSYLPISERYGCKRKNRLKAEQTFLKTDKTVKLTFAATKWLAELPESMDCGGGGGGGCGVVIPVFIGVAVLGCLYGAAHAVVGIVEFIPGGIPLAIRQAKQRQLQKNLPSKTQDWSDFANLTKPGCLERMWKEGLLPEALLKQAFIKRDACEGLLKQIEQPKTASQVEKVEEQLVNLEKKRAEIYSEWKKQYQNYLKEFKDSIPVKYKANKIALAEQDYEQAVEKLLQNANKLKSPGSLQDLKGKIEHLKRVKESKSLMTNEDVQKIQNIVDNIF